MEGNNINSTIYFNPKPIIFQINMRNWDPIHVLRIISNSYHKFIEFKNKNNSNQELINQTIKAFVDAKNNTVFNNKTYENLFQVLIYLISDRDKQYAPKVFDQMIMYFSENKPIDEDLIRFNLIVNNGEFKDI